MTETEYALEVLVTATLNASGAATVTIGPTYPNERWKVRLMSARGSNIAKLDVFRGNGNVQVDSTDRADSDTSNTDIDVANQEVLRFVWSSGTVGTTMTCSVIGSRYVRGRRAY